MDARSKFDAAVRDTERKIQRLLLDLEEQHGATIEHISVDTRIYANCSVQVFATWGCVNPAPASAEPAP